MGNIQETLNSLKPYVIGIRMLEGLSIVDAVFANGWKIPQNDRIKIQTDDNNPNYYMFFSEDSSIGFDEILDYVGDVINMNLEIKMKNDFFKVKVKELKKLFNTTSFEKLQKLEFTFHTTTNDEVDDIINSIDDDEDLDITSEIEHNQVEEEVIEEKIESKEVVKSETNKQHAGKKKSSNTNTVRVGAQEIELPDKRDDGKIVVEEHELPEHLTQGECNCGPDEACGKCIDKKDLVSN